MKNQKNQITGICSNINPVNSQKELIIKYIFALEHYLQHPQKIGNTQPIKEIDNEYGIIQTVNTLLLNNPLLQQTTEHLNDLWNEHTYGKTQQHIQQKTETLLQQLKQTKHAENHPENETIPKVKHIQNWENDYNN